jgi:hypothetical protein
MLASCRAPLTPINRAKLLTFSIKPHTHIHSNPHLICLSLAPTDQSAAMGSQVTMVIFFVTLLAASSSPACQARDRMMLTDHHAQPKSKSSTVTSTSPAASSVTSTTSSHRQLVQGAVAVPSPPAAPGDEVDHPESNTWILEGSVPSPGIGHHP